MFLIVENGGERSVRIKNADGKSPLDLAKDMLGWKKLMADVIDVVFWVPKNEPGWVFS